MNKYSTNAILRKVPAAIPLFSALFLFSPCVRADLWSTAYYPGWVQSSLAASNVDFTALSHVIHFSTVPNSNGSLDSSANSLTVGNSSDVVTRGHAAGKKVLFCVGGAGSQSGFQGATSAANLSKFVTNLVNLMVARSYDGIDLDWEPLPSTDFAQFTNLVNSLRTALNGFTPPKLLTAAVSAYPVFGESAAPYYAMFVALQGKFDQINVMTYDLSGAYGGWVTWFNAPLYNGGLLFPGTSRLVPSTEEAVSNFIAGGVAPGKLGIGIAFYGWRWSGGAGTSTGGAALPRQSWTTAPTAAGDVTFNDIMTTYYQSNLYHWDTNAQAAYLSIDNTGSANDKFISYDDAHTCQAKVSYARNRGLGGVMIWELGSGYRPTQPAGARDPLLQAVKQSLATPRITRVEMGEQSVQINFTSLPLANYRIQSKSNLPDGAWSTLSNNIPGTGGTLQITDPVVITNPPGRFYRVQTPP